MKLIGVDKAERKPVTYREAVFAPINRQKERVVTFAIRSEIDSWHAKTTGHNSKNKNKKMSLFFNLVSL